MTGHQINSLVGDLVAMAQAMERLPQVEAELAEWQRMASARTDEIVRINSDLEQARAYASTLEQKVRDAEVAKDQAETMFLEADERTSRALDFIKSSFGAAGSLIQALEPPRAEPEANSPKPDNDSETIASWPVVETVETGPGTEREYADYIQAQPEPIVSEVKPIAADPTHAPFLSATTHTAPAPIDPPQGQSEADPIANAEVIDHSIVQLGASAQEMISAGTEQSMPSWATPTPPKPQPYAGKTWTEIAATTNHYIGYNEWKEGGGTDENWNS